MKKLLSFFAGLSLLLITHVSSATGSAIPGLFPDASFVMIRANYLTQFVRVDDGGGLIADQTSWDGGVEEMFLQVNNDDGTVSFFSLKALKYVTARDTASQVVADATAIGPQQKFTLKPSWFGGWSNGGTDKVIFSNAISTTWNIAGDTDGRIFSQWWDESSGWGNMSVMPIGLPQIPQTGVDVSEGKGAQDAGVVFKDTNGRTRHYLDIFRAHGYRWARCRINVNPNGTIGLLQTTDYVKSLMSEAKRRGFKLLLDFHFSNWWADPAHQETPAAWVGQDINALTATLGSYVTQVMQAMIAANAWPDMIQIGNETDSGMLWPLGGPWNGGSWENYRQLHNAAYDAVAAARGSRPMPKMMIHIAKGGDVGGTRWWIDTAKSYGLKFDVIGLSYYPQWHGSIAQLKSNLDNINYRYPELEIAVAETAYYFAPDLFGYTGMPYPETPQGQYDFLRALKRQVALVPNAHYVFYWGGAWCQPQKWYAPMDQAGLDTQYRGLFDLNGKALKGIDGLK